MKIRLCSSLLVLFLLSGISFAQVPKPALVGFGSNEVSADFLLPIKTLTQSGVGGQIASTHFFGEHFGVKLQGDYESTDWANFREAGVRVGPIVRFATNRSVQPYLEALVGYARVKASYLKPVTSFHGSGSALAGGGLDLRLSGGWYAKAGIDFEGDWAVRTRAGRGLLGVSYRFGDRQSKF